MKKNQSIELSAREEQVLNLLLAGYLQKQIATILGISESRVQDVKRIVKRKWNVNTDIDFFVTALRKGYLNVEIDTMKEFANYVSHSTNDTRVSYSYTPSKRLIEVA